MIRLLVAEDEPAAMRYITSIVASHCGGVEIVAQAEDGLEAKNTIENMPVDILITDIQMPRMNGIELAQWVSDSGLGIMTLIVSGYSEFEYAKAAIRAGVADYLLKPFTPAAFLDAMNKLCEKIALRQRNERELWLKRAIAGTDADDDFPGDFQQDEVSLGVLVSGGNPVRLYAADNGYKYPADTPALLAASYIHDERQLCFALGTDSGTQRGLIQALLPDGTAYCTAFYKTIVPGEGWYVLPDMLSAVKKIATPGKSQILEYTGPPAAEPEPPREELDLIKQLYYSAANAQVEKIKLRLVELFAIWESVGRRLVSAEMTLVRLIQAMADNAPPGHGLSQHDIAEGVMRFCREAENYPDMLGRTWDYCAPLYQFLERHSESGRLIYDIETYIKAHLSEPLSAGGICAVFGISSSKLHKVFRKHVKMSLVEYITELRIEEAKRMVTAHPDMPIKDVAEHLGFSDQFYFSKVFRSMTGVSPSSYKTEANL